MTERRGPKVLVFDIETAPILGYVWQLFDQNVGINQIHSDWHVLSWAAKWLGDPPDKIMYQDQRAARHVEDDRKLLRGIWRLLDEADIVVTQNGKQFDHKRLNARFVLNGFQPPSTYKHIDTKVLAKRHFGFTSNRLEYMSERLCTKYRKLKHPRFQGFEMWRECLAGNRAAWREMETYNKHDVLALEELYRKLQPWDSTVNFSLYHDGTDHVCSCGSVEHKRNGWCYTATGKFQRYKCLECGAETRDRTNLFSKAKRGALRASTPRS